MASINKRAKRKNKFAKNIAQHNTITVKAEQYVAPETIRAAIADQSQRDIDWIVRGQQIAPKDHVHQGVVMEKETVAPFSAPAVINPAIEGEVFRSEKGMGKLIAAMALAAVAVATAVYFI